MANKFSFHVNGTARSLWFVNPKKTQNWVLKNLASKSSKELESIKERLNYYNKIRDFFSIAQTHKNIKEGGVGQIKNYRFSKNLHAYFFDFYEYARFFDKNFFVSTHFGDVREVPPTPTFVKSRPIASDNQNSIIINMVKIRHFDFVDDKILYESKMERVFFRGAIYQPWRQEFVKKFYGKSVLVNGRRVLYDVAHTGNKSIFKEYYRPKISKKAHFAYKILVSLEGNELASNLKWIMASNCLCFAPKMKFEGFFMEGKLSGGSGGQFVEIAPDFSDVDEKVEYYLTHENDAKEIIKAANAYAAKFKDKEREKLLHLLIFMKYFYYSQQLELDSNIVELF